MRPFSISKALKLSRQTSETRRYEKNRTAWLPPSRLLSTHLCLLCGQSRPSVLLIQGPLSETKSPFLNFLLVLGDSNPGGPTNLCRATKDTGHSGDH